MTDSSVVEIKDIDVNDKIHITSTTEKLYDEFIRKFMPEVVVFDDITFTPTENMLFTHVYYTHVEDFYKLVEKICKALGLNRPKRPSESPFILTDKAPVPKKGEKKKIVEVQHKNHINKLKSRISISGFKNPMVVALESVTDLYNA